MGTSLLSLTLLIVGVGACFDSTDSAQTTSRGSSDLNQQTGDASTVDPFDPSSCAGPAIQSGAARARWGINDGSFTIGRYTVSRRVRSCGASGCGPWQVSAAVGYAAESGHVRSYPLQGSVNLSINEKRSPAVFKLALVDDVDEALGFGMTADSTYGGGIIAPVYLLPEDDYLRFELPPPTGVADDQVRFTGRLTELCLRLSAARKTAIAEEEFALFAALPATKAPLFQPQECGGGAIQFVNCGAATNGQRNDLLGVCCPYGTNASSLIHCICRASTR